MLGLIVGPGGALEAWCGVADYAETAVRKTIEHELKLVPSTRFRLADLGEPVETRVLQATYYDAADLRLARHGLTLRRRIEDGTALWQLKIPSGAARIELEVPGPTEAIPVELTALLVALLREEPLEKVARLRTRRQVVRRDGAEIVEDAVSVFEGRHVVRRFREVEVELVDGDERSLRRLERLLRNAGAERGELIPKLYRALELSFEEPPSLEPGASPGAALGRGLGEQRRRLLDHDPGTRLGTDPEDLHQMRVATRRARAFLRAAKELVDPDWADALRTELGWLGSMLGPARDADVLYEYLTDAVAGLGDEAGAADGLLRALEKERSRARRAAVAALSRKRYLDLLDRLAAAERPPLRPGVDVRLADLWWKEFRRTRKAFAELDKASPDDELHAGRIRVKRARYAAELARHELGGPGERFVDAAKKLQDILGDHQDSVIAEEWIVRWGDASPESGAVVARLLERERKRRRKARRAWPDAWEKLARKARQARR